MAIHALAEVVVIANGVQAGRRSAFAERVMPTAEATVPVMAATAGGCQDQCCA